MFEEHNTKELIASLEKVLFWARNNKIKAFSLVIIDEFNIPSEKVWVEESQVPLLAGGVAIMQSHLLKLAADAEEQGWMTPEGA